MSQGELESMLQVLRDATRGAEAPERVEAALRSAFRARAVRRARRRGWPLAIAAAAVVLIGAAAAWMVRSKPQPQNAIRPAPAPVVQPVIPPGPKIDSPVVVKQARRPRRPRVVPAPPPSREEVATDFIPLDETLTLPPIESGQVVRVQLPRSAMIRFGLPVNQDRMLEPVNADVVFAQDGIARAIRFVK